MVRKIDGIRSGIPGGATPIDDTKSIKPADIRQVEQIKESPSHQGVSRVRRATRPMTPEEREHLLRLVNEEAEKMFGSHDGISSEKKETVKKAVKMVIQASGSDDDKD